MRSRAASRLEARRWPRRTIATLGALMIVAIVGWTIEDGVRSYRATRDKAWLELDALARAVAEQTARSLQAVDVVLRFLVAEHEAGTLAAMTPEQLHKHLREQSIGLIQTETVAVFDRGGLPRGSSRRAPGQLLSVDASNDAGFRALRASPDKGLVIGESRFRAPVGIWAFPISRTLRTPSGEFDGTVTALGRVDYFQNFYRDVTPAPGTRISLRRRDTSLVARHPPMPELLGKTLPALGDLIANAGSEQTTGRTASPLDGVDRLGAIRVVSDYPLVVVVARDASAVFAEWRALAWRLALRTIGLAGLATALLVMALRQLARTDAARRALEGSTERFELAAAGADDGIWDWDMPSDTLFLSPRAQQVTFGDAGEPLRPRRDWIARLRCHPDDDEGVREAVAQHLRGATPHLMIEYRVRHGADPSMPDSGWHWCRQRGLALRDSAGRAYRMAGSIEDITARKQAQDAQERLELQLRQAQKLEAIGTLAGGIAHDFNNILAAMIGFGDLARADAPEGSRQRLYIDASLAAGARAKSLVERILAFSRTGMVERVPVHVQSAVAEALDMLSATLPPDIRIERHLAAGDAALLGDPVQVHQVVMNLCVNAVQATTPPGTVVVDVGVVDLTAPLTVDTSTLQPARYVRLAVHDSGSGIPARLQERVFEPFFSTKAVGVGTGLGLSLVHGIVADLGGGIAIDSRPGIGSTFTVYLAASGVVAAPPPVAVALAEGIEGQGQTVMLVDDETALVELGEETLAALGYEPVAFSSSAQALTSFREDPFRFDLLLTDESMPDLTGCELAMQVHAMRADLPVILMSGHVTPALCARARRAGIVQVLGKPLARTEMARCVASALARRADLADAG